MFIPFKPRRVSRKRNKITGKVEVMVLDSGQRGLGLHHWREWVNDYFLADPQVEGGDILLADRLNQHKDEDSKKSLQSKGIKLRLFPAGAAADLSQIDNCLVKDFRADLCKKKYSTFEEKKAAVFDTWEAFPSSRIVGYWAKCEYTVRHCKPRTHSVWSHKD